MKKMLILLSTMTLLLSACGSETPVDEEVDSDAMVATVVADMMAATVVAQAEVEAQATIMPTEVPIEIVPTVTLSTDFENAASIQTQLIIGIYQLENTAQAITKDQASFLYAQLLTFQASITNQALTEEEINVLVLEQVAVLSAEQIQSISSFQITEESAMATIQELGIQNGAPDGALAGDTAGAGGGQHGGGGAGGEGSAPPADGSGAPPQGGGQGGGGGQAGTMPDGQDLKSSSAHPQLLEAIITLLEDKINS